jgi:triosephosphate isomerase
LTAPDFSRIIIAYEPVWAIGTGRVATPEIAGETHAVIREQAARQFGPEAAEALRILYGGSVKPDNVEGLMARPEIDGALVGGASLKPDSFAALVNYPGH